MAGPVARTYTYDAAGNIISDGTYTFTYNAAGRLSQAVWKGKGKGNSSTNAYQHNGMGQRVIKTGSYLTNGPYYFLYDEAGHLVEEYDASNNVREETVWLGDTPVAVLKKDAQGQMQAYAIHADHLDTPRAILDSQNRMVWRWLGSAFGQNLPEEDPDGDGRLFEYNLRFPGQYYDKETSLHYNYFRDYDPSTGRYVQSDPIGLEGGMNTYGYVGGSPIIKVDPFGLCAEDDYACQAAVGQISIPPQPEPTYASRLTLCLLNEFVYGGAPNDVEIYEMYQGMKGETALVMGARFGWAATSAVAHQAARVMTFYEMAQCPKSCKEKLSCQKNNLGK